MKNSDPGLEWGRIPLGQIHSGCLTRSSVVPGGAKATACAELDGIVASQLSELAALPLGSVTRDLVAWMSLDFNQSR